MTGRPPSDFVGPDGHLRVPEVLPGGPTLRAVVARLLAHAAEDRHASARAVREALLAPMTDGGSLTPRSTGALAVVATRPDRRMLRQLAVSPTRMLFPSRRPSRPVTARMYIVALLVGMITLGVGPIYNYVVYLRRRARLERFLAVGTPAVGHVLSTELESDWIEVVYEYSADGAQRRGVDRVFPSVAHAWQPGDTVQVLYIVGAEYDSVVVSTC